MVELLRVQRGQVYAGITDLVIMHCPDCGVTYAIPTALQGAAYQAGHRKIVWFCPNGHELGYNGASEAELEAKRLREERDQQARRAGRLVAELDQTKASLTSVKGSLRAQKGHTTRVRKRAAAALCPCCNRSFVQLQRHLAAMHPDYKP